MHLKHIATIQLTHYLFVYLPMYLLLLLLLLVFSLIDYPNLLLNI